MCKIIKILMIDDATLIYLFSIFMFGIIHKKGDGYVYGVIFGIWNFQLQLTLGYSNQLEKIGEIGHA